jgi:hypothetical protein
VENTVREVDAPEAGHRSVRRCAPRRKLTPCSFASASRGGASEPSAERARASAAIADPVHSTYERSVMQSRNISDGFSASSHAGPRRRSYVAKPPSPFCRDRMNATASLRRAADRRSARPRPGPGASSAPSRATTASAVQSLTGQRWAPSEKHQPPSAGSRSSASACGISVVICVSRRNAWARRSAPDARLATSGAASSARIANAVSHAFERAPAYRTPSCSSCQRQASRPSRLGSSSGWPGSHARRTRQFRSPFTGESPW